MEGARQPQDRVSSAVRKQRGVALLTTSPARAGVWSQPRAGQASRISTGGVCERRRSVRRDDVGSEGDVGW